MGSKRSDRALKSALLGLVLLVAGCGEFIGFSDPPEPELGDIAKVRVYLEHSFQGEMFGTVGVNVDIIKASWNALIEAYQYALMQHADFLAELGESRAADGDARSRSG